ncbi:MAG: T9SS type A sorting domain-containing protein [Flavobacteriales bacterium]
MKKIFVLIIALVLIQKVSAQEGLEPLKYNYKLQQENPKNYLRSNSLDGSFIYKIDTINLPFIDDFSTDKFKSFNAKPGDANVSDTVFYAVKIGGLPDLTGDHFLLDTTYDIRLDSVGGVLVIDSIATVSLMIEVCDLAVYPIVCQTVEVWRDRIEIDSMWTATSPDLIFINSNPTPNYFVQDSITIYFVDTTSEDLRKVWADNFVYRNPSYGIDPPSIGVATFDGLDETGYPYNFTNSASYGIADVLTSKPINLFTKPLGGTYAPVDSVYLSFFYQPQGLGEAPDNGDSLVLQLLDPDLQAWNSVWKVNGQPLKAFEQVMIPIKESKYFKDGFRFRFRNYGNLSGALDHWHIDYVYLNINRTQNDTVRDDVAFVYPVHTLLEEYTAMPWTHYETNPSQFMKLQVETKQHNNNNTARNVANQVMRIFKDGVQQTSLPGPNFPFVTGDSDFFSGYSLSANSIIFDPSWADTIVTFDVTFEHSVTPDALRDNDTIRHKQVFVNYYAYDDGTAEAAYGIIGTGSRVAYKFHTPVADTIRAIKIHFVSSVYNASNDPFILTVWGNNNGQPGGVLMENDLMLFSPYYGIGVDEFVEYRLQQPIVVNGTFFVGVRQTTPNRLNIGFDLNRNLSNKIYFNTGANWQNTSFQGALMIRPVFTTKADSLILSVPEIAQDIDFSMYPNPADQYVIIESNQLPKTIELIDLQGRVISNPSISLRTQIKTEALSNGIYLIRVVGENAIPVTKKIVVQH